VSNFAPVPAQYDIECIDRAAWPGSTTRRRHVSGWVP